jgi:SAM-dependent methyltransferase
MGTAKLKADHKWIQRHFGDPRGPERLIERRLKADYKRTQRHFGDSRDPERLIAHYELERRLADRLRASSRHERVGLYTALYAELFAGLPDHPQNTKRPDADVVRMTTQLRLLRPMLTPTTVFLELGCGDAKLTLTVASLVAQAIALDVTDALLDLTCAPPNFRFVKTSGVEIALPDRSVDLIYANQLMEHLHVDDVDDQLREIVRVLRPGGRYLCITPSRVTGPHDISCFFDDTATGFHMREYDYGSMRAILLGAGFRRVDFPLVVGGRRLGTPPYVALRALEVMLSSMPSGFRRKVRFMTPLMGITAIGIK